MTTEAPHKPDVAYVYDKDWQESVPICETCGRLLWFEYIPGRRDPDGIDGIFHHVSDNLPPAQVPS